jgi:hypothetical protein
VPAPLAGDYESLPGWRDESHVKTSIGEYMANVDVQKTRSSLQHGVRRVRMNDYQDAIRFKQ